MKERQVYITIKACDKTVGFSIKTDKSIKEIREFYSVYGVISLANWDEDRRMSAMSGVFMEHDMSEIIKDYDDVKIKITEDKDEFDKLHEEYQEEKDKENENKEEIIKKLKDISDKLWIDFNEDDVTDEFAERLKKFEKMSGEEKVDELSKRLKKLLKIIK